MLKQRLSQLLAGIIRGISRLTYQDAYVSTLKRLEQRSSLEDLGRITASIEHDLRNPLAVMDNQITVIRRQYGHDERLGRSLEELHYQLVRIRHSLATIPLFRGEAEYFRQSMRKIEAGSVINAAIKDLKKEFRVVDSIKFKVDDRRLFIRADPRLLEQAVLCILKNSVEAIHEGKRGKGLIAVKLSKAQEMGILEFVDDGCGFPEGEYVSRVRDSFTSKDYGGPNRGLGLFMVTKVLELHDGTLRINSAPAKGTSVALTLPLWVPETK